MTNIFKNVLGDLNSVEQSLFGESYDYVTNIKTPNELGMSSSGSKIANNVSGLINYIELLVSGGGRASKSSKPLGNKFFLKTGGKCKDVDTKKEVERSIYVNNVPDGDIPFISSGLGVNFTSFRGLVPGTISNVNRIKPFQILQSFLAGNTPDCKSVNLETIDANNKSTNKNGYLTLVELKNMSPCWFLNGKNPITKKGCRQTFTNINNSYDDYASYSEYESYDEEYNKLYITVLSVFMAYLILKITKNRFN
jgi:hypothetical protein